MRSGAGVRARRAVGDVLGAWRGSCAAILCVLGLAGCVSDGGTAMMASAPAGQRTIAFDSIDGPPRDVFQRLVESIAAEATGRQVAVISREANPTYRIRGYLAAHVVGGRTHIGYVWDVYDGERRRALRIAGEEPAARRKADAWAAADDQVLRRIARSSMERLAGFLGAPSPARPPAEDGGDDRVAFDRTRDGLMLVRDQ